MTLAWLLTGMAFGIFAWETGKRGASAEIPVFKKIYMVLWMLFILFTVSFVITSIGEGEPRAAGVGALVFGILAIAGSMYIRKELSALFRKV